MSQKPVKVLSFEDKERIDIIEELVLKYQEDKSEETITNLLYYLAPMLHKYTNIIKKGKVTWKDKNTQTFLYAFLGSQGDSEAEKQFIYQDKLRIMSLIFGQLSQKDVYSEMQLILFILLERYKPMDRTFCGYLGASFPYEVARYVRKFTASQSAWHPRCDSFDEECFDECIVTDEILDPFDYFKTIEEDSESVDELGHLNDEWVKKTDSSVFADLKPKERQLIKLYYQDQVNDREISMQLNCHINTANQQRRKAIKEVSEIMGAEPARIRRPAQEDRKGVRKIPKTGPIVEPLTIEKKINSSPCPNCLHVKVCKHHDWYTKRIMIFNKSDLLEDVDAECFSASLDCLNYYKKEA